jgi:hypothetical protein
MVIKVTTLSYILCLLFNLIFGMVSYFIWKKIVNKIGGEYKDINLNFCRGLHVLFLSISFTPGLNVVLSSVLVLNFIYLGINSIFKYLKI